MTATASGHDGLARWATTGEIKQQPAVWRAFASRVEAIAAEIKAWRATRNHDEVWFCGAGSSAFVGETLAVYLNRAPGRTIYRAVPTTDIVATPTNYIRPGLKLLVVLIGRSGNSSESVGVLNLLAEHAPEADRLHITCNGDSALGRPVETAPGELRTIVLPPQTNDSGFAMTSSYSTMLLTALACFDPAPPAPLPDLFNALADAADAIIKRGFAQLPARAMPKRAVFLGAGPQTGSARECALKVQELTAGTIAALWDAPLGFRHGPKAFVNGETSVFVFLSPDPNALPYTVDLANEIAAQYGADTAVRVGDALAGADIEVPTVGNDAWGSVLFVLVAQMLGVIWSDRLGFNVDDPFAGRNLTRVIANVKLYPLVRGVNDGKTVQ
jgi:fructoselysine-6-P-deglycase FrlB-like protein